MQEIREKLPLDAKLLSEAIIELNISARNVSIYPEDHPSIEKTINKVHELLQKLFEIRSSITLAVAKDTLIIDHHYLDKKNPVYKEFALALFNLGIAFVTFFSGLTKEEIINFHKIITSKKDEIEAAGGMMKAMEDKKVVNIQVSLIDYSVFHAVEDHDGNGENASAKENVWETFVYGLLEGRLSEKDDEVKHLDSIPPDKLAALINRALPDKSKQETYDRVITSYLRKTSDARRNKGESFTRFLKFIDGLKPSLKKQFLSGAFNFMSVDSAYAEEILSQLSTDNLLTILQQINEQDAYIPPQLKGLLEKFSKLKGVEQFPSVSPDREYFNDDGIVDDIQIDLESFKLLADTKNQSYVSTDYQGEIDAIVSTDFNGTECSDRHEMEQAFDNRYLDSYALDIYLELLNSDVIQQADFRMFAEKLKEMADLFLEKGEYREVASIYNIMLHHSSGPFQDEALKMLAWMNSESFIRKTLWSFRTMGRKYRDEAIELSLAFGEQIVPHMINALVEETSQSSRKFLMTILSKLGKSVVREAKIKLDDSRWYTIRNMIILFRECNAVEEIDTIKKLCSHTHVKVALEALRTLLHFEVPEAFTYLAPYLRSNNLYIRDRAIVLAGAYKIRESVPILLELLRRKETIEKVFTKKIPIVKALASIGDTSALPSLIDIFNMKSFLFKSALEELKIEIIRTLTEYPHNAAKPLIDLGLASKNKVIHSECLRITKLLKKRKQWKEN